MKGEEMAFITPAIETIEGAFSVKGYNVVVTGGYSGIGLGIATAYAEAGANVAILGRNPDRGKAEADLHKRGVEREHPRQQHIRREQYRRDGELTCSYLHYYNTTFLTIG